MRVGGSGAHAIKGDFALTEAYLQGGDHKIIKITPLV